MAALLLILSGIISAAEVAFFSLTPSEVQILKESDDKRDRTLVQLLARSEYLLNSLLVANNFVNVAIITLCAYGFQTWIDFSAAPVWGLVLEVVVLLALLLLFGEIIPRIVAWKNVVACARSMVGLLSMLDRLLSPLSEFIVRSTAKVDNKLSRKKNEISVDELSKALELTSPEIKEEKEMLAEIIKFYNKTADEIMTPRLDMDDLDIHTTFREVVNHIVQSGYSRIPIYDRSEDHIKGILYIKDLLPHLNKPDTFRWQTLIRPAYFVPETKKIDDLLEEFRTNKIHMAIVVDEFGGTSGIVTLEDILEEIVGDISDEYDEDEQQYIRLSDGSFIFEAKIPLTDFFRVTGLQPADFDGLAEEPETLAGLLLEIKGDFPSRREIIEYKHFRFQVLEVDRRRILKVKYTKQEPEEVAP